MLDLLIKTVEEYNELQQNEDFTLDWWDDVIDTLKDRNDEKEIAQVIETIQIEIKKLK